VTGIVYISKKVAMFFFGFVIDIQRFYRLKLSDEKKSYTSLMGYTLSVVVLIGCMIFCSALLVFACMFSVNNDYSRTSIIIHNALQVHLSIAIQKAIGITLLYVDHFHMNIYANNHHFLTIGAFFCESLVRDGKQYYHYQRSFCNHFIVVDYVVTMEYADKMGWISKTIDINPMVNGDPPSSFANRLTVVTKRISDTKSIEIMATTINEPLLNQTL
jgi:hypothetical protein